MIVEKVRGLEGEKGRLWEGEKGERMRGWEGERRYADCADEAGRDRKKNGKTRKNGNT